MSKDKIIDSGKISQHCRKTELKKLFKFWSSRQGIVSTNGVNGPCPFCSDGDSNSKKFGIMSSGIYNCFACATKGHVSKIYLKIPELNNEEFLSALEGINNDLELTGTGAEIKSTSVANLEERDVWAFPDVIMGWFDDLSESDYEYLQGRGISKEQADVHGLVKDVNANRILFPVRNADGKLAGLHGRALYKHINPKYLVYTIQGRSNTFVFYREHLVDYTKPVIITESFPDSVLLAGLGYNVLGAISCTLPNHATFRLRHFPKVIFMFDNDAAGTSGVLRCQKVLNHKSVNVENVSLPVKHVIAEDIGELYQEEGIEYIKKYMARSVDPYLEE